MENRNNKKHILIFSTAYYPFVGGAEVAIREITDRLSDVQFDLITARLDRKLSKIEKIGNVNVCRVGIGNAFVDKFLFLPWLGFLLAKKLHQKNKYDLAWSMMASQASVTASRFKDRFKDVKLLLTLQEGDEESYLRRYVFGSEFLYRFLIKPFSTRIFKKVDRVTVISNYLKKRAIKNGVKCKIDLIPNAVDYEFFSQNFPEDELKEIELLLEKKSDEKFIITTSRLVLKNAVDDLIKSLQYLDDNYRLLVLGDGQDKIKLKETVKELNLQGRVEFLGLVDHDIIPKYLKISDVFVRPSLSEGMGNSFIEAMATGTPVVATPVGGIPDFLFDPDVSSEEKSTGLFCEVRNPKSIAEKIILLSNDNILRLELVGNAKKLVQEKYDWKIIAKDMDDVFFELNK